MRHFTLLGRDLMNEAGSFYYGEAERLFQQAYEKQMEGQVDEAIELYRQSLELHPTAEAYTFLGWAYSFQGRYDDAIRECQRAIEQDPDYGNPYNDIGAYMIEKGRLDEAAQWLDKALGAKRYDSYCYPYYNLGRISEQKGDWLKAFEYYDKALRENPDYTLAKKALGRLGGMLN
jgi:tetratricopeptide (TPR) repeat protein